MGIPLIGEQTSQKISERIYEMFEQKYEGKKLDLEKVLPLLQNITKEELEEITDIGPLAAQSFKQAFQNKNLILDLRKLHEKGIYFFKKQQKPGDNLKGLKFVITGTLPETREEVKKRIEEKGGQVFSQLSRKIDFLIEGEIPGSKKKKAQELNVKTLSWEDFLRIIRG